VSVAVGRMRHRISVEARTLNKNAYGEDVETWSVLFQTWAWVRSLSGRELMQAQQVQSLATHEVTMRYRPGLDATVRVDRDGRKFNVVALIPDEKNEKLRLLCAEPAPTP
jgi:SPP1 family predicted phage head-tail adaptor